MTLAKMILATTMAGTLAMSAAPAMAQHHPAAKPGHTNGQTRPPAQPAHRGGMKAPTPQEMQKHMQEEEARIQHENALNYQELERQNAVGQRRQAQIEAQQQQKIQQGYDHRMRDFEKHRQSNGGAVGDFTPPTNPRAFREWERAQKAAKANKKPYNPAYDQYVLFEQSKHPVKPLITTGFTRQPTHQALTTQDRAIIHQIEMARVRLAQADHDYDGYRVMAIEHLGGAIHALDPSNRWGQFGGVGMLRTPQTDAAREAYFGYDNGFGYGYGYGGYGYLGGGLMDGPGNVSQAKSDAILHEVMRRIKKIDGELFSRSGHATTHVQARSEVETAIEMLNVALAVN